MSSDTSKEKIRMEREDRERIQDWIRKVRQGDQKAFEGLAERYAPLIDSLTARFCREEDIKQSREDLRQEAMVVFYHSILTYDLEQSEVEFGLYAKICISNALISQFRLRKRQRAEQVLRLAEELPEPNDTGDPTAKLLEQERLDALWSVIEENLSRLENRIWRLYMSGRTAKEIASLVGKDEKAVTNGIYRIRRKLRDLLR